MLESSRTKICAAIVTYGDRFKLLSQTLNYCLSTDLITSIAIVDNNSCENTVKQLNQFKKSSLKPVYTHRFSKNNGSAFGFKKAIELADNATTDLIFLLDDDNLPEEKALEILLVKLETLKTKTENCAVVCNRVDRINFKQVIATGDGRAMLQPKNHYLGFHFIGFAEKLSERIFPKKVVQQLSYEPIEVPAAPYSGLLFHKQLLKQIGLPNEKFVLYMDDFDFTLRIGRNNGRLWLIPNAIIYDLENSVYLPVKKKFLYHSAFDGNINQMYYSFRNMKYLGNNELIDKRFIYFINKILFWTLITTMAVVRGKLNRITMLQDAVKDADNGSLGINQKYLLS